MNINLNWQVIIPILILAILILVLLWLLPQQRWNNYAKSVLEKVQATNPASQPINWSAISGPDSQGLVTTTGTYELGDSAGKIGLKARGKQFELVQEYIQNAKFYFVPVYEKPPEGISVNFDMILSRFATRKTKLNHTAQPISSSLKSSENPLYEKTGLSDENELILEYDFLSNDKTPRKLQTIVYKIDPPLGSTASQSHYSTTRGVYAVVTVSPGSVACTLYQGNYQINSGSTSSQQTLSSWAQQAYQYSLTVQGRSIDNYYTLSGTWNVS